MKQRLSGTLLKVLQFTLGYVLMLVVMTYNVWLFLAIILGFGAGYGTFYNASQMYIAQSSWKQESRSSSGGDSTVDIALEEKGQINAATDKLY